MFNNLKVNGVYKWTKPETCAGLEFRVIDIRLDINGENPVYRIKYLNYKYYPRPVYLEITRAFVMKNAHKLLEVNPRRTVSGN